MGCADWFYLMLRDLFKEVVLVGFVVQFRLFREKRVTGRGPPGDLSLVSAFFNVYS